MQQTLIEVNTKNVLELSNDIEELTSKFKSIVSTISNEDKQLFNAKILENQQQFSIGLQLLKKQEKDQQQQIKQLSVAEPQSQQIQTALEPEQQEEEEEEDSEEDEEKPKSFLSPILAPAAALGAGALIGQYGQSNSEIGSPGDTDGQQTGLDMSLAGGIGAPINAPIDLIYKSKGTDGMPSVGLNGTAEALGPSGSGFGYYGAYYYQKNGKLYEVLMGHFAAMAYKGSAENQPIPKGTLLGYQGASGRTVRGDGTNNPYPHISLHINGVGFRANNQDLLWFANLLKSGGGSSVQPQSNRNKAATLQGPKNKPSPVVISQSSENKPQSSYSQASSTSMLNSNNKSGLSMEEIYFATV